MKVKPIFTLKRVNKATTLAMSISPIAVAAFKAQGDPWSIESFFCFLVGTIFLTAWFHHYEGKA